jgi:hypothetical protein
MSRGICGGRRTSDLIDSERYGGPPPVQSFNDGASAAAYHSLCDALSLAASL